jgi:predicted DNA-binding transcriptional regulator YafY
VRADRLVSLVLLLQARGRMTARELAAELGVSVRTVYRDLEGLSASAVPVYCEPGPGGGCQLLDGYRFPLRALLPEEAEALLILGVPSALRELGLDGAVTAAHRQIRLTAGLGESPVSAGSGPRSGPRSGPTEERAAATLVHLDMPPWFRSHEEVPHLRDVAETLRQHRQLELRYRRDGATRPSAPRVVAPLGLVNKAGTWYLVAVGRAGRFTVFRVSRIASARMLADAARRPPGFDLAGFWEQWSREFAASRPQLQVRLRASARALAAFGEVFGPAAGDALNAASAPDEAGWRELTLSFEHDLAAAHRLAGFGEDVQVISPPVVRDHLIAAARGILSRYGAPIASVCDSQTRASASLCSSPSTEASG